MVANDIGNSFIEYLTVYGLKDAIEDKVTQVSIWIQKCKNANVTVWMKLKAQVDNDFMYVKRFVNEFKKWGYLEPDDYYIISGVNIAEDVANNLEKTISSSKKMIEDTTLIVNSNVEAQNSTVSYRIQRTTFYTNLFSAIAALIAIIISLLSDKTKNILTFWLEDTKVVRCAIYVVTFVLIFCLVQKVVMEVYRKIKYFIIFQKK